MCRLWNQRNGVESLTSPPNLYSIEHNTIHVSPPIQGTPAASLTCSVRDRPTAAPPVSTVPSGLIGSPTRVQEVANPGRSRHKSVSEGQKQASLADEVAKLAAQVAALEQKLSATSAATPVAPLAAGLPTGAPAAGMPSGAEPSIGELMASLAALTEAASADAGVTAPTSARVIGSGVVKRPATAPYRSLPTDSASVVSPARILNAHQTATACTAPRHADLSHATPSACRGQVSWSADAFGKSKTPGWYHTYRSQLYKQRAARAAVQPKG